jgi:AraC-like DNA-binding protein
VLQIVEVLQLLGTDARSLRAIVGRSLAGLSDPWVRLPRAMALELFEHAERRTGDRLIGLHAGQQGKFHGPLAHLFASAPRLRPALELYGHFSRLAIDTSVVRLDVRGDTASLVISPGGGTPSANRHLMDYTLMASVRTCWRLLPPGSTLREIHVRHPGKHYGSEAERAFGCRVHFQKPDDRIVFPARDLDRPLRSANPLAGAQIEKALAALPPTGMHHPTFEGRVEQAARGLLVAGRHPDQAMVAKRLHVSVRSLQRRLEDEGTTFRTVRDGVLRALVEAQLWNPALSIKEIALGLGYADAAALSKAYRRWTGQPPTAFRDSVLSATVGRRVPAARRRAT